MRTFILTTIAGQKLLLTSQQRDKIVERLKQGATHIEVNRSFLLASTIASIVSADEYIASENQRLNGRGKWMCKHGKILAAEQRCECGYDERLTDTSGLICTIKRIECRKCQAINAASNEFCDACSENLPISRMHLLAEDLPPTVYELP